MKKFRHLKTVQELGGFCCLYSLAKVESQTGKAAAYLEVSRRSLQRLKKQIRLGEVKCEKKPTCWLCRPLE